MDKSGAIGEFAHSSSSFFLSRPEKIEESFLFSSLESLFSKGVEDFRGCEIEKNWADTTYPVLRLDFSALNKNVEKENFTSLFYIYLTLNLRSKNLISENQEINNSNELYDYLDSRKFKSIVLLLENYDAPLLIAQNNKEALAKIESGFIGFFTKIKNFSDKFRFILISGRTPFYPMRLGFTLDFLINITEKQQFKEILKI